MKGINTAIHELKGGLQDLVNNAKLPPAVLEVVFSDILTQLRLQSMQAVEYERKLESEEGDKKDGEDIQQD
ncbi:MAG: hypothetical protein K0S76_1022 [Herbinix sp.]|jgi:hypothetical protein|nr:hypothetical protein [Herbinix sp.]